MPPDAKTQDLTAVVDEIERLLDASGNYQRRIQYTDWNTTTPETLIDCFAHALRKSHTADPNARFWWVETGAQDSPLIVGYLGNGPSSEVNAWLLGAGPKIVEGLRSAQADLAALRDENAILRERDIFSNDAAVKFEHEIAALRADYERLQQRFAELDLTLGICKEQKARLIDREDSLRTALESQRQATEEAMRRAEEARRELEEVRAELDREVAARQVDGELSAIVMRRQKEILDVQHACLRCGAASEHRSSVAREARQKALQEALNLCEEVYSSRPHYESGPANECVHAIRELLK